MAGGDVALIKSVEDFEGIVYHINILIFLK
jgi:hypothetical protein